MNYEIHLYVPKTGKMTQSMMEWLFENGQEQEQPEIFWPVRKLKPKTLARYMLRLDPTLKAIEGPGGDIELHYPDPNIGIVLYIHDRGIILFFPYMSYSIYSRIILGISYTYIRYLYDKVGFWSFDPQLDVISYADDFQSMEDTAMLMDAVMPKLLGEG
jgi:hypothetical protein